MHCGVVFSVLASIRLPDSYSVSVLVRKVVVANRIHKFIHGPSM